MAWHLFKKKFKCGICGAVFDTKDNLDAHSKTHEVSVTGNQQQNAASTQGQSANLFQCETCGQQFSTREELDAHIKTHGTQ